MSRTPEQIRHALWENEDEPEGRARNARAEALVAEAAEHDDKDLLIHALCNLVSAYTFSIERDKTFVPFARLLRMWDEEPGAFQPHATHLLHWMFKWVSSGMLDQPHIPLASIEKWQAEMERRYRLGGYSERAVRSGEFCIAWHLGDQERASHAYDAWRAADRDEMADCHACELRQQGEWKERHGHGEEALKLWRPVLEGVHTCRHQPHGVLADSLLPLVRLGRTDEARGNHLRGYRMVRDMESMRHAIGSHLEFCALTGNEARGLEILAEQTRHWDVGGDPDTYLSWTACVAVLLGRLTALGHGDQPVPGPPGRTWTAQELYEHATAEALDFAGRFDARNGTTSISDRARERMAREPLLDRLPLGLRGGPPSPSPGTQAPVVRAAAPARTPAARTAETDPRELLAEARRLSDIGHPTALAAWARLDEALERSGTQLTDGERAELLDHRGVARVRTDPAAGAELFHSAAGLYDEAGLTGEATACRARAVLATAYGGGSHTEALEEIEALCARATALHAERAASTRHATAVLLTRARIRAGLLSEATTAEEAARRAEALDTGLTDLVAFAAPDRAEPAVLARIAEATEARGRLAAEQGEADRAAELLAEAAALCREAGRPWHATSADLGLARLLTGGGEAARAADVLTAVLEDPEHAAALTAADQARVRLALADARAAEGRTEEESAALLHAAHWADQAGEGDGLGAYARLRLGGTLFALDRWEEAATVLEAALPDLRDGHQESDVVQARTWLGQVYSRLEEHRAAAEQFLEAASTAQEWVNQFDHALLAHLAADALKNAEAHAQSRRAYERAEELWRSLGDRYGVLRTLRSRAWLACGEGADTDTCVAFMEAALREIEEGLAEAGDDGEERTRLLLETGHTHRQIADLALAPTDGAPDEEYDDAAQFAVNESGFALALEHTALAADVFRSCGDPGLHEATGDQLRAASLEVDLDRPDAARGWLDRVRDTYPDGTPDPDGTVAERLKAVAELENRMAR
ncbi:tetratricopeptide repeat protein [Streptomyces sp. NPDC048172]|uniref:tetratricopeptide repeat protein n=1 Tax=Streptomyces sp. NPDC048172 TaxID=3365505 RepID=UPI0037187A96